MKALVKAALGSGNLGIQDVPVPEIGDEDVLMKVDLCGICGSDLHTETGRHPCVPPVTLGHEYVGTVAKVGRDVQDLEAGDSVSFLHGFSPFPGTGSDGGFAEYMRVPARSLWKTPEGVSPEEATQFEMVICPMRVVRDIVRLQPGERVVITGPGPLGVLAANMARLEGASHITVLGAPGDEKMRLPKALELGADEAVLFGDEALAKIASGDPPTCWLEASGAPAAIQAGVDLLARGGRMSLTAMGEDPSYINLERVGYDSIKLLGMWGGKIEYIRESAELMREGKLNVRAIITDVMPMSEWEAAFARLRALDALKILLDPSR